VTGIIITILSSSFKFAMTFPLAVFQFNFGFVETILWTNVGGTIGIYFFEFLSGRIMAWWKRTFRWIRKHRQDHVKKEKVFTGRNRRIIRIKQRYGLIGIAFITPLLLSIPVGVFLVVRYYHARQTRFIYLIASNLFWSVIYTMFYLFWDGLLFKQG
jgi:hypothetical protein